MRLRTWIIFGAGYAWGAWNGRDRLTELADRARDLLGSDLVRDYVGRAQSTVAGAADRGEPDEGREPDDEEEPEDLDEEEDEYGDEDETEDLDGEPEEEPEEPDDEEPQPARSRSRARRRAPSRTGRSRR